MIPKSGDRFSGKIMLHQCRSAAGSEMSVLSFERGGYRFLKGVFQYSAGVAAMPGHCIVRVRFRDPVPLAAGFQRIARSNVCPAIDPPPEPSFHAFCYTEAAPDAAPSFVIAGSGEAPEGRGNYRDHIVRLGDVSPAGLRDKARFVLGEMERRMAALGFGWRETTATQLYTVHDIHPFLADEVVRRGAARSGLTWHFNRPPVVDLEYEMDCRGVAEERIAA